MSLAKPVVNLFMRWVEKPGLRRAKDQFELRRNFEFKARFLMHPPRNTTRTETTLAGRPAIDVHRTGQIDKPLILFLHGGGYVFGNPGTHSALMSKICSQAHARGVLVDYRKAPENQFPAAVEDAEAAYLALLAAGEDSKNILIGGDSAGGGLAMGLLGLILQKGHPKPAGAFAFSPLTDHTFSSDSVRNNASKEAVLPADRIKELADAYLGETAPQHPWASPVYADFKGAPPVWLCVGDTEILLDDSQRIAANMRKQGVEVDLTIESDLPHIWPIFHNSLPEARATIRSLTAWIRLRTGGLSES